MACKNIVLVSFYSPGDLNVGYRRMLWWANELAAAGYSVYFVTLTEPNRSLEHIDKRIHFLWLYERKESQNRSKVKEGKAKDFVKRNFGQLFHPWIIETTKLFWCSRNGILRELKPNETTIIGSHPPWHSLLLSFMLKKYFKFNMIVDFRDLFAGSHLFGKKFFVLENWLQNVISRNSKALITVSNSWLSYFSHPNKYLIPNGYDVKTFSTSNADIVAHSVVRYFGTITFLDRVSMELVELIALNQDTCFEFYGDCDLLLNCLGNVENVSFYSQIPYSNAINLMKLSGANLLVGLPATDVSRSGMLQTKAFEYMAAKRPILYIGDKVNPTFDLVAPSGLVICHLDDLANPRFPINHEYIESHSRNVGFKKLLEVLGS